MIEKFWEKIGENLAGEWDLRRLGPALVFWAGGLLLCWEGAAGFLGGLMQLTVLQAGVGILVAVVVVILSTLLVSALTLPVLRIFEGYWTPWPFSTSGWLRWLWPFRYLQQGLAARQYRDWYRQFEGEYQSLIRSRENHTPIQAQRYAHLDAELLTAYPKTKALFLPTKIGNLLRAAEEYPQYWYGLQAAVTWPRLWLLLPEAAQKEISQARQQLDDAVTWLTWAILFSVWRNVSIWTVAISILAAFVLVRRVYASAQVYGELIRAAYDLYRFELYKALNWQMPNTPEGERSTGAAITQFLRRRTAPEGFSYHFSEKNEESLHRGE